MDGITIIMFTLFLIATISVIVVLNLIQSTKTKRVKKVLEKLEYEKNKIEGMPIVPELSKIESFLKNEKIESMYNEWKDRHEIIKKEELPKLTDMLIEADYLVSQLDYKGVLVKIAKLEMELYKIRTNAEFLLNEIKEITTSDEKNRAIITNLKIKYRDLYQKFSSERKEYKKYEDPVSKQFEIIAKRFEEFEKYMELNEYSEVTKIINVLDDMLKHMEVVVEETPAIILTATSILPNKIKDILANYKRLSAKGYPLDYLNIEYNVEEANNKILDVMKRLETLNLEDSLFELKILLDYFDGVYEDFEKEKSNKSTYDEANLTFKNKLSKTNSIVKNIFVQIEDIKKIYNLSKRDIERMQDISARLEKLNADYKLLEEHTGNHTFAYSKLTKEISLLMSRLSKLEEEFNDSLSSIGNMKEDEVRAREQLDEVKRIFKQAKNKVLDSNLPLIPDKYYVILDEARASIEEGIKEISKKPITISVLNTRVDTARDLVLKLLNTSEEMVKTAGFVEMAIVYGNRYRTSNPDLCKHLSYSETLFFKGEYRKSLELTINALNKVESGIYEKLVDLHTKKNNA